MLLFCALLHILNSVTEDSNTEESTKSVTSINLLTIEPFNSNIAVTMKAGNDDAKNKEESVGATEGAESGGVEEQGFMKGLEDPSDTTGSPSKPYLSFGSPTNLTRDVRFELVNLTWQFFQKQFRNQFILSSYWSMTKRYYLPLRKSTKIGVGYLRRLLLHFTNKWNWSKSSNWDWNSFGGWLFHLGNLF